MEEILHHLQSIKHSWNPQKETIFQTGFFGRNKKTSGAKNQISETSIEWCGSVALFVSKSLQVQETPLVSLGKRLARARFMMVYDPAMQQFSDVFSMFGLRSG